MLLCYKKIIRKTLESAVKSKKLFKKLPDTAESERCPGAFIFSYTQEAGTPGKKIFQHFIVAQCCLVS